MKKTKNKGITLVSLIITIIVLLILVGVTLNLVLNQDGIINLAQQAGNNYIATEEQEKKDLEDLYSSMLVATNDDSKITISMEDLNSLIESKVNEKTNEAVQNALATEDITSSLHLNTNYVSKRGNIRMTKSGNTVVLTAYLNVLADIPALSTIITIDNPYRTTISYNSAVSLSNTTRFVNVLTDGSITVQAIDVNTYKTMAVNLVWQI